MEKLDDTFRSPLLVLIIQLRGTGGLASCILHDTSLCGGSIRKHIPLSFPHSSISGRRLNVGAVRNNDKHIIMWSSLKFSFQVV